MFPKLRYLLEVGTALLTDEGPQIIVYQGTMTLETVFEGEGGRAKITGERSLVEMHRLFVLAQVSCGWENACY